MKTGAVSHYKVPVCSTQVCAQLLTWNRMVPVLTPKLILFTFRWNRKKYKAYISSACKDFQLHVTVTATKNSFGKLDELLKYSFLLRKLNYFPRYENLTLQGISAENGGGAVGAQSLGSKTSHGETSSFYKNSSSKVLFFFPPFFFVSQTHFLSQFPMILQRLLLKPDQA